MQIKSPERHFPLIRLVKAIIVGILSWWSYGEIGPLIHQWWKFKLVQLGTSLAVQWLRPCASTAGGTGLIPGRGTRIPCTAPHGQKKEKKLVQPVWRAIGNTYHKNVYILWLSNYTFRKFSYRCIHTCAVWGMYTVIHYSTVCDSEKKRLKQPKYK